MAETETKNIDDTLKIVNGVMIASTLDGGGMAVNAHSFFGPAGVIHQQADTFNDAGELVQSPFDSTPKWHRYTPRMSAGGLVETTYGGAKFNGLYLIDGDTAYFNLCITFASDTAFGAAGGLVISLPPVFFEVDYLGRPKISGLAHLTHSATEVIFGVTGELLYVALGQSQNLAMWDESGGVVTSLNPWTWGSADTIRITGRGRIQLSV